MLFGLISGDFQTNANVDNLRVLRFRYSLNHRIS